MFIENKKETTGLKMDQIVCTRFCVKQTAEVGSNIAQYHLPRPYEVISGHYLPQLICKVDHK